MRDRYLTEALHSAWQIAIKRLGRTALRLVRPLQASFIGTILCLGLASPAYAPSASALGLSAKEYASKTLNNKNHFKCLNRLYSKESAWNPKAVNGPHYGIPQGKSIYLKNANKYQQIDWGIRYISVRYGNPCKALSHFTRYNWH